VVIEPDLHLDSTQEARKLLTRLVEEHGSHLVMVIAGGCCDNTAPQLYKDFKVGPAFRLAGRIEGVPVYFESQLLESYRRSSFVLDVSTIASPSDSFSLETIAGYRFKFYLREPQTRAR